MKIDFYFDFISPFSYLAAARLPGLQAATEAEINWLPVNLPRLIKLSGNIPPASVPNKARYLVRDLKRQARKQNLPLKLILPGSFDSRPALAIACALSPEERCGFCSAVFSDIWSGGIDVLQSDWLEAIFSRHDLPQAWAGYIGETEKGLLQANTLCALRAGAFGVPSFVLHKTGLNELFFGLDHMNDLQDACLQQAESK